MKDERDLFKAIQSRYNKKFIGETAIFVVFELVIFYVVISEMLVEWFESFTVIFSIVLVIVWLSTLIKYLKSKPKHDLYYSYFDSSEEMIEAIKETLANDRNEYKDIDICVSNNNVMLRSDHTQIIPFSKITSLVKISNQRILAINELRIKYSDSRHIDEIITMIKRAPSNDNSVKRIENRKGDFQLRQTDDKKDYVIGLQGNTLTLSHPVNAQRCNALAEERRRRNNDYIISQGITCFENLKLVEASCDVELKSIDEICTRAIVGCIAIAIASDIHKGDYEESINYFRPIIDEYGAYEFMNEKEKRIVDGTFTTQDAIDIDWEYETLWSLLYALSLVDDIHDGGKLCDCNYIIGVFKNWPTLDELKQKCKLRNIEEILDMLDLYYRYHWACVDKSVNPNTNIGNLNPHIVVARRRGLEWIISKEEDWYKISLDT